MKIKQIIFALVCGSILTTGSLFAEAESSEYGGGASDPSYVYITHGRYNSGGILSVTSGFGIGHAVQGRWLEKGWIFTTGEIALLGGAGYLLISWMEELEGYGKSLLEGAKNPNESSTDESKIKWDNVYLAAAFFAGYLGLRVWEVVDAWVLPSRYKVSKSPFELSPLYSMNNKGDGTFGLSLKYKF